jgi:NAD(P)-dependent dehydrogenase (short-subunit alcohol dehydrogenase family)
MRHVLVTGAGHGIGAAIARRFAAAGDAVLVTDIDPEAARTVAHRIREAGGQAAAHELDVGSAAAWRALRATLEAEALAPDVIVNNAFRTVDVTLGGVYHSVHTFAAPLTAARGTIVNVGSVHGVLGWPGHPAYAASKGGVIALTRQLAVDYGPEVRVNAVLPGSIDTRVWDAVDAAGRAAAAERTPLNRLGTADEVAAVVEFLAGSGAAYVTGAVVAVDGGLSASAGL